MLIYTTVVLCN